MIVCFNHGNGLADPMVLIRKTPRVVRFCAKDTLWKMPIMNWFIRGSGAVPVYRRREHGEQAESLNLEIFAELIAAMRTVGIDADEQQGAFRALAALLHGESELPLDAWRARDQAARGGDGDRNIGQQAESHGAVGEAMMPRRAGQRIGGVIFAAKHGQHRLAGQPG